MWLGKEMTDAFVQLQKSITIWTHVSERPGCGGVRNGFSVCIRYPIASSWPNSDFSSVLSFSSSRGTHARAGLTFPLDAALNQLGTELVNECSSLCPSAEYFWVTFCMLLKSPRTTSSDLKNTPSCWLFFPPSCFLGPWLHFRLYKWKAPYALGSVNLRKRSEKQHFGRS